MFNFNFNSSNSDFAAAFAAGGEEAAMATVKVAEVAAKGCHKTADALRWAADKADAMGDRCDAYAAAHRKDGVNVAPADTTIEADVIPETEESQEESRENISGFKGRMGDAPKEEKRKEESLRVWSVSEYDDCFHTVIEVAGWEKAEKLNNAIDSLIEKPRGWMPMEIYADDKCVRIVIKSNNGEVTIVE